MPVQIPTTLVLGAGSSVHVGFPLGMSLVTQIVSDYKPDTDGVPGGFDRELSDAFIERLSRSGYSSIDAFLERNPDFTEVGKYLIAKRLVALEDEAKLFIPHNPGWYQYLLNCLAGDERPSEIGNKITVVTFNYDRSIEAYLYGALQARFNLSAAEALRELECIPIHHVHGQLGPFPDCPYRVRNRCEEIREAAEGIKIIHEVTDGFAGIKSDEFAAANRAIKESDRVFFLGFGFHVDNVRRLGAGDRSTWDREIIAACALRGSAAVQTTQDRVSDFGLTLPSDCGADCETVWSCIVGLA